MRKALIVCITLLVLAAAALLAAPRFIDLDWYRGTITAELRRTTGLPVEVAGPLSLSLLPTPRLSAAAIRIANPAGAAVPDLLRATSVEVRLAVAPLLTGKLVFRSLTLVDPVLDRTHLPRTPPDFALERLAIVNGTILGGTIPSGERIDGLALTASLADSGGPAHAAGGLTLRGTHVDFELDIDRIAERMPFRLALDLPAKTHLLINGDATAPSGGALTLDAKATLTGEDFAAFARLAHRPMPAALARPFTAAATLAGSTAELRVEALDVVLDDMHATGALRIAATSPASISLTLALNQLNLDRPASAAAPSAGADAAAPFAPSLPADLSGQIDLTLGALRWHGGIIRDARLQATLDHGAIDIPRLVAALPGGSGLSLNGRLDAASGQRQFRGAVELDSDNLRALLDWLGMSTGAIPADRLRKLTLSSQFTALPDRVEIGSVDLTIDATRLTGAATVALRQRVAIGARLAIDQLNLDAYLPAVSPDNPAQAPRQDQAQNAARDQAANGYTLLFDGFDANIDAAIDTLTWRGQPARGVHLAATLQDGALTLRQATIADIAGATATASGALSGSGESGWHAAIALQGPEIAHLVRLVAPDSAASLLLSGPFTAKTDIAGERGGIAVDLDLAALGGRARITGEIADSVDLGIEVAHPSFAALMRNVVAGYQPAGGDPGAVKLAGRLSETKGLLSAREMTLSVGGLTIEGDAIFERRSGRPKLTADLRFGELALDRFLPVRQTAALVPSSVVPPTRPPLWLAQAGAAAVPPGAAARRWSREPFSLAALGLIDSDVTLSGEAFSWGKWRIERPIAVLALAGGRLRLDQLSGGLFGGTIDASGELAAADGQAKLNLAMHHAALEQALQQIAGSGGLAGRADVDIGLATSGLSATELADHLQGNLTLASRDGTIAGIDLPAINARLNEGRGAIDLPGLVRGLSGGRTRYHSLDGTFRIADGIMRSDDLRLAAEAAEGRADATLDLPKWLIHSHLELRLTEHAAAPPLGATLDGAIDAPHIVFDVNALEGYLLQRGSGRPTARPGPPEPSNSPPPARPTLREPLTNPAR
ncbi:MAG TPA: AsmA family protein [Stellaceae bacterium]|nr:AsmA family protein [Stellaceae bacterium]